MFDVSLFASMAEKADLVATILTSEDGQYDRQEHVKKSLISLLASVNKKVMKVTTQLHHTCPL